MSIDWQQKRWVYYDDNSGEYYVKVETGYMLDVDYMEGGRVIVPSMMPDNLEKIGHFTNAEIDNGHYLKENGHAQPE